MKRLLSLIGLAAIILLMAALALSEQAAAADPQTITVSEVEYALQPNTFTVQAGSPVQFTATNNGTTEHNLTVELPSAHIEQKLFDTNLKPGETRTATYTFPQAGQWEIYCPVPGHEDAGMKGTVNVQAAAAAGAATPTGGSSTGGAPSAPTTAPQTGGVPDTGLILLVIGGLGLAGAGLAVWGLATVSDDSGRRSR